MTLHVKEGGTWREVDQPFVNVEGTWKTVREVHVKHGGSWRHVHTTPYTEYTLGSAVSDVIVNSGESGTYTIPTGQGIAYIKIYVEGGNGGGGGGAYSSHNHWTCPSGTFSTTQERSSALGGWGQPGGSITCIHRVYDGDYISWGTHTNGGANNGAGGTGASISLYMVAAYWTSYPSVGTTVTGTSGNPGFQLQCNIRNSSGTSKAQLWAGGGNPGAGGSVQLTGTCDNGSNRGYSTSKTNGAYGAAGGVGNSIVTGSDAISVVEGNGDIAGGNGGNLGNGSDAQNKGKVTIQLYTPDKY